MTDPTQPLRVLILGGGGTLGAFSAGALLALERAGWIPDAMIGSSAGSINLLRYLVGGAEEAARFWTTLAWRPLLRIGAHHRMFRDGILDPERFRARVEDGVDFDRLRADPRSVGFLVVNLETGRVKVRGNRSEPDAEALRQVSAGSYALPPLLPPVPLGDELLADGGLLHNAPLEQAMKLGATEILYLCNVQVLPRGEWAAGSALRATARYMEIFFRRASNVGFADAEIVEGHYRGVPFLTVAPPTSVRLESIASWMLPTHRAMQKLVDFGRDCAERALSARTLGGEPARAHRPTVAVKQALRSETPTDRRS